MGDLYERLQRAKNAGPREAPASVSGETAPEGWEWVRPLVARRSVEFAFDGGFVEALVGTVWEDWYGTYCLDVEATGLSGGAGTVAFLVGWAEVVPGPRVRVTQWFLRDHPGEHDLVAVIDAALAEARTLVTFNGASYDLPLLRSRWTLAGQTFPDKPHRDDLHPARRFWKRLLESCRLSSIEDAVLGIRRTDDVAGALVPELWFSYLRSGAPADFATPLEGVLRHHAQDVYSLLCLDLLMAALRRDPENPRWEPTFGAFPLRPTESRLEDGFLRPDIGTSTPVDFWGLTQSMDDEPRDRSLSGAWDETGSEAVGLAWALRLKRQNDPAARTVWTALWESRRSYQALEELLKWLEHREKTFEARQEALARIAEALDVAFLPRAWRDNLEKRRTRLERKLEENDHGWKG